MPVNTGIGPKLPAKLPAAVLGGKKQGEAVAVVQVKDPCRKNRSALRSKPIPLFIDGVLDQIRISVDQPSVGVG